MLHVHLFCAMKRNSTIYNEVYPWDQRKSNTEQHKGITTFKSLKTDYVYIVHKVNLATTL